MRFAIKEMREKAGLTLEELSRKSGVPVEIISDLEENKVSGCESKILIKLAEILNTSVKFIFLQ